MNEKVENAGRSRPERDEPASQSPEQEVFDAIETPSDVGTAELHRHNKSQRRLRRKTIRCHPVGIPISHARCGLKCNWCCIHFHDKECRPCVRPAHDPVSRHRCDRCFATWYEYRTEDIGDADEDYDLVGMTEVTALKNGTSKRPVMHKSKRLSRQHGRKLIHHLTASINKTSSTIRD